MGIKFNTDSSYISDLYLADYFIKTRTILKLKKPNQQVTIQWFQREDDVTLAGIQQIIEILRMIPEKDLISVHALNDGDKINNLEPVLKITGPYYIFGWLEGLIDGIFSRATSIATNSARLLKVANNKTIINMNDRADHPAMQSFDGYASYVGGMRNFVSLAAIKYIENQPDINKPKGTMPHALIQAFGGDIIAACRAFLEVFPSDPLVALVDFNNDCVNDALKVANEFKTKLSAIRIDTSNALIDKYLQEHLNDYDKDADLHGVCPELVFAVRNNLDKHGFEHVKIIASSGFDAKKIAFFENLNAPVDIYGVGEAITKHRINFTGDAVNIDGIDVAKVGRKNMRSARLNQIKL